MKKLNIAVVFGGRSQEFESSLASGGKVIEALKKSKKYKVIPVGITREGKWYTGKNIVKIFQETSSQKGSKTISAKSLKELSTVMFAPDTSKNLLIFTKKNGKEMITKKQKIDVAFAWVLGPNGEDGTLQGLFEVADIPYVGCGVFASATGFNKKLTKIVLNAAGIPQAPYLAFEDHEWEDRPKKVEEQILKEMKLPLFVKPASCGSSIGVSKVKKSEDLKKALKEAFQYDTTVLIESGVENVREIECAVLGDEHGLEVSIPGEVHYEGEFYDYNAKYLSKYWEIDIPPKVPKEVIEKIRTLAAASFRAIQGSGAARVDFLVNGKTWEIFMNEMNTIPNFRPISCYPHLLREHGISYEKIIDRLIEIALKRDEKRKKKNFSFVSGADWFAA